MGVFSKIKDYFSIKKTIDIPIVNNVEKDNIDKSIDLQQNKELEKIATSNLWNGYGGWGSYVQPIIFNGEKNIGGMGNVEKLFLDYQLLSLRGWQLYYKSDLIHTIVSRKIKWVVGDGLKLKSEPDKLILKNAGINIDTEKFTKTVEAYWKNYASTNICDYNSSKNLHQLEETFELNCLISGDVLVILRYINGVLKVQLIDGRLVQTPPTFNFVQNNPKKVDNIVGFERIAENGNYVRNGVELDKETFSPVAYYVLSGIALQYVRIPIYNDIFNTKQAWLFTGLEYRLDCNRGVPAFTPNMEASDELQRYKSAMIASAEVNAKLAVFFEHDQHSTGENPLQDIIANKLGGGNNEYPSQDVAWAQGNKLADKFSAMSNGMATNLPVGAKAKALDSKRESQFKEFYEAYANSQCSTFGIPPNVAFMLYNDSFSASRAALKDWEHTLIVDRADCGQFKQMVYNFWLDMQILTGKIKAAGYLDALHNGDYIILAAYRNAAWVGAIVPHIDPLKEVRAEREKLGKLFENIPLTDLEQATMNVNGGNSNANISQAGQEIKDAESYGFWIPKEKSTDISDNLKQ